uniref:melatonin receptor type 1B-A-like isoform X2 n=1 Tax=Ciona intestinalis TaxID=7719 RepID=UPI00089DCA78|nr:melatonin receptor type 1B-A-like isoform X2 [Ciona intestinalis]|eukprot:XP_018672604.1 melatonin receptor type 1B-A-like isoform X2 [Ciona intestinalis]
MLELDNSSLPGNKTEVYKLPQVEIVFLLIVIVIGSIGNLLIIGSIRCERRLKNSGVGFITNLALADLAITAWYMPVVLANVLSGYRNVFEGSWLCEFTGFLSCLCCEASLCTLMFISMDRYWKLIRPGSYETWFSKRKTLGWIAFIWIASFLIALPLIVGWQGSPPLLTFNEKMMSCMWNDEVAYGYNIFLVSTAIFVPLCATGFFYFNIFAHVRRTRKKNATREIASPNGSSIRAIQQSTVSESEEGQSSSSVVQNVRPHHSRHSSINSHKNARSKRVGERERALMLTLMVVVVFFVLFWCPIWRYDVGVASKCECVGETGLWLACSK